jgi:hypothetical protein
MLFEHLLRHVQLLLGCAHYRCASLEAADLGRKAAAAMADELVGALALLRPLGGPPRAAGPCSAWGGPGTAPWPRCC